MDNKEYQWEYIPIFGKLKNSKYRMVRFKEPKKCVNHKYYVGNDETYCLNCDEQL